MKKKKSPSSIWLRVVLIIVALGAIWGAYYLGSRRAVLNGDEIVGSSHRDREEGSGIGSPSPGDTPPEVGGSTPAGAGRADRTGSRDIPGRVGSPDLPGRIGSPDLPGGVGSSDLPGRGDRVGPSDLPGLASRAEPLEPGGPIRQGTRNGLIDQPRPRDRAGRVGEGAPAGTSDWAGRVGPIGGAGLSGRVRDTGQPSLVLDPEGLMASRSLEQEDICSRIEREVEDYCDYLDTKGYVQDISEDGGSYGRLKQILVQLSSNPPIPAGEAVDPLLMTRNIYHFFRALDKKDLRLIKGILKNETESLEIDLDLLYRWLRLKDQCPDPAGVKPGLDVLYKYAGFLLNTIGGRAYLFRRPSQVRLLVSYYCLLILHEADKQGLNYYGVDIYPFIPEMIQEIRLHQSLLFQQHYLQNLKDLSAFYFQRR